MNGKSSRFGLAQRPIMKGASALSSPNPLGSSSWSWLGFVAPLASSILPCEAALQQLGLPPGKCQFAGYPGWFWVYSARLRIYYNPARKAHASGRLTAPVSGATIPDMPTITFAPGPGKRQIERVEFIGQYEDFDWEGDGVFRKWHFQYFGSEVRRHIGTSFGSRFTVEWDTQWIPDQEEPIQLAARVVDRSGLVFMTPAVSGVTLTRQGRSVKMFRAADVPQGFGVRVGTRKTCTIN
ncbi:MAG: hypothetical protein L0312_34050, partial [Acidobacteria bacterium]|nr:hypothetical protein [Acidobacteriota bacterium]